VRAASRLSDELDRFGDELVLGHADLLALGLGGVALGRRLGLADADAVGRAVAVWCAAAVVGRLAVAVAVAVVSIGLPAESRGVGCRRGSGSAAWLACWPR